MGSCLVAPSAKGTAADIESVDARFARLMRECPEDPASRAALRDFFVASYSAYAYKASRVVRRGSRRGTAPSDEDLDAILSVALDAIETVARSIEEGRLGFRGDSRFSSYLFGVVKRKSGEARRGPRYVPKEVKDLGPEAEAMYRLSAFEGLDAATALGVVAQATGRRGSELRPLRSGIGPALARLRSVGKGEGREPKPEAVDVEELGSTWPRPDEELERKVLREACDEVLLSMRTEDAEMIELRFVRGMGFEEIRDRLGLPGVQAARNRLFKARKAFAREARRLRLEGLFRAFLDGGCP